MVTSGSKITTPMGTTIQHGVIGLECGIENRIPITPAQNQVLPRITPHDLVPVSHSEGLFKTKYPLIQPPGMTELEVKTPVLSET